MTGETGVWLRLGKEPADKGQLFEEAKKENSRHTVLWFADLSAKTLFFSQQLWV